MSRSKSLIIILWFLGLLLAFFVSRTLAVDPYYRPANPVMDFVPQTIVNSNSYYISVQEPYSASFPNSSASAVTPTPASCENCHFWNDPVNPTIHGIGEMKTLGPYGSGMHPDKLALGFDPNNLPSLGTHHEIGVSCWFCHPDELNTNPYDPQAIKVCENCHSVSTLHGIQEHMNTNNIYTVKGVPNQTVTADEKCIACHGDGPTMLPLCSCRLTPDNPPVPSVPRGGSLGFQATAINNTSDIQIFKYATRITLPSGNKYPYAGYLLGPIEVTLNPNQSKSKRLSQYIPPYAPLGRYTYRGYVGNYGVGIYDECWFTFEVTQ